MNNWFKKTLFFMMGLLLILTQALAPFIAIVFFAVSPLSVLSGERLVAGQQTISESYICHMGIEWHNGSQQYLPVFGFNHANHSNSTPDDHSNHHNMDHSQHTVMQSSADISDTKQDTPEPCIIEKFLNFLQHNTSHHSFSPVLWVIVFLILSIIPFSKRFILSPTHRGYYQLPNRQAPPFSF